MLKQRVITALILAILLLAALFALPGLGWAALVLGVVGLGAFEWGRLSQLSGRGVVIYLVLTLIAMAGIIGYELIPGAKMTLLQLSVYGMAVLFWLLVAPLWLFLGWHLRRPVIMALVGWLVLLPTGLAMVDLRGASPWLLLFVMALVWMADIAAYFSGKKFGKRKLAPTISPGKTWEGVAGAIVGVTLYVVIVTLVMSRKGGMPDTVAWLVLIAVSWLWVVFSIEGDLFESAVKRQAGVKDSGALLPGHGGVLDRIDAMTSTLPLAALVLTLSNLLEGAGCGG